MILVVTATTALPIAHSSDILSHPPNTQALLSESAVPIGETPFFAEIAELVNANALADLSVAETHIFRPLFRYRAVTVERQQRHELKLTT